MDTCLLLGGDMAGRYSASVNNVLHPALASMITLSARGELVARQNAKTTYTWHRFQDTFMCGVEGLVSTIQHPLCSTLIIIFTSTVLGTRKL